MLDQALQLTLKITPYKNYSAINGINKQIIIIIIIMTSYATAGLKWRISVKMFKTLMESYTTAYPLGFTLI